MEGEVPAISVVIAAFNGASTLGAQLDALAGQLVDGGYEVIVADNGSTDDTVAVARAAVGADLDLRVIDASARRGQAFARNQGASAARAPLLAFVDQDDVVAPGYLQALVVAAQSSPLLAARMDTDTLNPGWVGRSRSVGQDTGPKDDGFPWAYGCALGISAELFAELGGFGEGTGFAAEDVELCWRAHLAGHVMTFVPDAVVAYRYPTSLRRLYRQGWAYARAGQQLQRLHPGMPKQRKEAGQAAKQAARALYDLVAGRRNGLHGRGAFNLGRNLGHLRNVVDRG